RRLRSPSRPLLHHAPLVRRRRRLRSPSRSLLLHATSHTSPASLLPPPFPPHSSPCPSLLHHSLPHLQRHPGPDLEEEEEGTRRGEQESFPNFPLHQIFVI
uniref:Uncharacterized protein n=1 Tax=Triticum urartu TaxID=4572 RepID=A0A8R7QXI8_TRIUA